MRKGSAGCAQDGAESRLRSRPGCRTQPEHVLWMQSGHAQDRAARQYVVLNATNPELLFRTFEAFRL